MYDSYNAQLASTHVQSLTIDNASKTQSLSNEIKYDVTDKNHKYDLCRQFVTWACKSFSAAPLTDYPIMKFSKNFQLKKIILPIQMKGCIWI